MNNPLSSLTEMINLQDLLSLNIWTILKWPFLLLFLLYLAFAFIVVRQVGLMSRTLNGVLDTQLKLIAWLHLLVSLFVFVLALIIL